MCRQLRSAKVRENAAVNAEREALTLHTYWYAVKNAKCFACFVPLCGRLGCSNGTLFLDFQERIFVLRMLGDQIE